MAVSNVAPPHISRREQASRRPAARHGVGARQHVVGAHARGHQRLVRVAEGRVGDEQPLLLQRPFGEFLRAEFQQQFARARRMAPACDRNAGGVGGSERLSRLVTLWRADCR